MDTSILGWDIGGAHVKAALINGAGEVAFVTQHPCPLWKGIWYLQQAIDAILAAVPDRCSRHAVTMTGELVDCFASREEGVHAIIQTLQSKLATTQISIFAGLRGFLPAGLVQRSDYLAIASANWIASAQLAAKHVPDGLFVDIGSTTTDILLIQNHTLLAQGYSDHERLVTGELLYTGVVRTAVMAVASRAVFKGQEMGLMAEHFATMADVYRLTGDLNEAHDQCEPADGAEKTAEASARRLSRLTGYDFNLDDWAIWVAFAHTLKQQQRSNIRNACVQQLQRKTQASGSLDIVGAGVGRFLAKEIAEALELEYCDFNDLLQLSSAIKDIDAADCAPAVAVAYLAGGFG